MASYISHYTAPTAENSLEGFEDDSGLALDEEAEPEI